MVRLARILSIVVEAEAYRGHRFWFKDSPFGFYTMISLCCMSSQWIQTASQHPIYEVWWWQTMTTTLQSSLAQAGGLGLCALSCQSAWTMAVCVRAFTFCGTPFKDWVQGRSSWEFTDSSLLAWFIVNWSALEISFHIQSVLPGPHTFSQYKTKLFYSHYSEAPFSSCWFVEKVLAKIATASNLAAVQS